MLAPSTDLSRKVETLEFAINENVAATSNLDGKSTASLLAMSAKVDAMETNVNENTKRLQNDEAWATQLTTSAAQTTLAQAAVAGDNRAVRPRTAADGNPTNT